MTLIDCDHRTPPAADSGYPYVAIPQLKEGRIVINDVRRISPEHFGALAAEAGKVIVSGAARGIDSAAMSGAMDAGGKVIGIMADSLGRAALAKGNREALREGRLVVISAYDPAAGFNVGHAMQRNKAIYALADAALVVTSDFNKGGTWAGAIEQLDRLRFVPVFVRNAANAGKGNAALLHRGGRAWPEPRSADELESALAAAAEDAAAEPMQDTLPLTMREEPPAYQAGKETKAVVPIAGTDEEQEIPTKLPAEAELWHTAREILRRELVEARTEEEVAILLVVTKPQARAWLARLIKEGVAEKVKKSKPATFRAVTEGERLI